MDRLRRTRMNRWARELVRETRVDPEQMVQPLFVVEGLRDREPVPGLTGVFRETPESLLRQIEADMETGVRKFLLFGVPGSKGENNFDGSFTATQVAAVKKLCGADLFLAVDVCLCSSTTHGQCGVLSPAGDRVVNDPTVSELVRLALACSRAGADCVAPSDMMDGRVAAIRTALDSEGLEDTLILSYAAKFHSKFYGPFRAAADSAPQGPLKDRSTYQIDPSCFGDALRSARRDAEEGADLLMVKPGLPYLDVLHRLSREIPLPWAAYEVSGEYAAVELLAREGLADGPAAHVEAWTALARAGAQVLISYGARHAAQWLRRSHG